MSHGGEFTHLGTEMWDVMCDDVAGARRHRSRHRAYFLYAHQLLSHNGFFYLARRPPFVAAHRQPVRRRLPDTVPPSLPTRPLPPPDLSVPCLAPLSGRRPLRAAGPRRRDTASRQPRGPAPSGPRSPALCGCHTSPSLSSTYVTMLVSKFSLLANVDS